MAEYTYQQAYNDAVSTNNLYNRSRARWQFLLDSHSGGDAYRQGAYLQRYQLESEQEYQNRLLNTPLDNQCKSLISLYVSFLFRTAPQREFGVLDDNATIQDILEDADLDGRSMDAFMRDVAIWAGVFGHCWVVVAQPDVGAVTLADQQQQGVRPYLSVLTPLSVTDWRWIKQARGGYSLSYIKYIEEVNDTLTTFKEWTADVITTTIVDTDKKVAKEVTEEVNGLGRLPFVCVYAERSPVRGIGNSMIDDIADQQRLIYNELSEVFESIRLDTHPSLVTTSDTNVGTGAGALIHMPENLDPALKPYVLQFQTGAITAIYDSINNRRKMIDAMGNVGSVRATETTTMSGIAMATEFQLLNARLCSIGKNLELGEEQIWQEVSAYLNTAWTGEIAYPTDFALRNIDNELSQLVTAIERINDPARRALIEAEIMKCIDIDDSVLPEQEHPTTTTANRTEHIQGMIMAGYEDSEILARHPEISQAMITAAKTALLNLDNQD
jgi:hypothetical protein